uniref:Uncharacterized protein n=1 Tax=Plectus sambesii TaxID=2011161 RepID=A0A914XCX3_9BILA
MSASLCFAQSRRQLRPHDRRPPEHDAGASAAAAILLLSRRPLPARGASCASDPEGKGAAAVASRTDLLGATERRAKGQITSPYNPTRPHPTARPEIAAHRAKFIGGSRGQRGERERQGGDGGVAARGRICHLVEGDICSSRLRDPLGRRRATPANLLRSLVGAEVETLAGRRFRSQPHRSLRPAALAVTLTPFPAHAVAVVGKRKLGDPDRLVGRQCGESVCDADDDGVGLVPDPIRVPDRARASPSIRHSPTFTLNFGLSV